MRTALVQCPGAAGEIGKRAPGALAPDHDIGAIDRSALVTLAVKDRRDKWFDGAIGPLRYAHIEQAAEEAGVQCAAAKPSKGWPLVRVVS